MTKITVISIYSVYLILNLPILHLHDSAHAQCSMAFSYTSCLYLFEMRKFPEPIRQKLGAGEEQT